MNNTEANTDIPDTVFLSPCGQWNGDPIEPCMIEAVSGAYHHKRVSQLKAECGLMKDTALSMAEKADDLIARNVDLGAIVEKLPKTADGVVVFPGMKVYPKHPLDNKNLTHTPDHAVIEIGLYDPNWGEFYRHGIEGFEVGLNYSTPQAARDANQPEVSDE